MYPPINLPCFLVSEEPGEPKALQQARNPARGGPSPSLRSSDLPRDSGPSSACAQAAGRPRQGAEPKEAQDFQPELSLVPLDMAEPQQLGPSQTLLEDPVQAPGQDVGLLIALTALLPAFCHLFHPIVGASNGPSHGGNGVCVPTQ